MKVSIIRYKNSLSTEIAYRLHYIETLFKELSIVLNKEKLDKQSVHNILFEIRNSIGTLKLLLKKYDDDIKVDAFAKLLSLNTKSQAVSSTQQLEELMKIFKVPKIPTDDIENLCFHIDMLLTLFAHASDKLGDEYYREKLYELIPKIKAFVEHVLHIVGADTLSSLAKLIALTNHWNFGERWLIAVAYLQALEIIINKLIENQNIEIPENAGFKEKFKAIMEHLRDKDIELVKLEEKLPPVLWELRNKIVHAGYEPSEDELNTIMTWTYNIISKLMVATYSS
ncbi:hypothetical protein Igag_0735 [Ignisphaera aggregans DSM 17230]|uniref:Uncharacterized protein n=1 Tax=Ignisphaera aggregans (strain DSM 17230 / JCM 13409 / AQ1.S1) TaxID=583356 RepID=E0ST88_IGNAA|nr:hypothetical protein Igag_0735 [Ignisphaera aggregans DSM 17230]